MKIIFDICLNLIGLDKSRNERNLNAVRFVCMVSVTEIDSPIHFPFHYLTVQDVM